MPCLHAVVSCGCSQVSSIVYCKLVTTLLLHLVWGVGSGLWFPAVKTTIMWEDLIRDWFSQRPTLPTKVDLHRPWPFTSAACPSEDSDEYVSECKIKSDARGKSSVPADLSVILCEVAILSCTKTSQYFIFTFHLFILGLSLWEDRHFILWSYPSKSFCCNPFFIYFQLDW